MDKGTCVNYRSAFSVAAVLAELERRFRHDADVLVTVGVPVVGVAAAELQAGPSVEFGGGEPDAVHAEPKRRGGSVLDVSPAVVAEMQHELLGVLNDEVTARGQLDDRYRVPPASRSGWVSARDSGW